MKKNEVKVGDVYVAKVSNRLVPVRIDSVHSRKGWNATNTKTGRRIRILSPQRLRRPAAPATKKEAPQESAETKAPPSEHETAAKPKRMSALNAAARVLRRAGKPMGAKELILAMAEQGLWQSPGGKTPHSTLYAAMQREERQKGNASRFRKVGRGLFAYNEEVK